MEPKKTKDTNEITREYLDSILIEERLIDAEIPKLDMELWGTTFSTPIMMPAFSHLKHIISEQENAMVAYARAAKNLNMLNFVGMTENDDLKEILEVGAKTVRIIKPYADKEKIFDQIAYAEANGAFAVGMDIDHIFGSDGRYDNVMGEMMTRQTVDDISAYVSASKLPFVVKGVLSVTDALKSQACGAKAIIVSHHHGRMPFAVPPLQILPEIIEALGADREMKVWVDCGISSGVDVFKALALGADAAATGQALMPSLTKSGTAGVEEYVTKMNQQLAMMMAYTGFLSIEDINDSVLRRR